MAAGNPPRLLPLYVLASLCCFLLPAKASSSFLDVYIRVQPVDDFCGARQCNISYAVSMLAAENQFDLQSVMLQDGSMTRNRQYFFEDNTVIRLTRELRNVTGKLYLGVMLFDVPDDIQDYTIVDVTDVIHRDRRAKTEFSSETVRIRVHVYKRNEALLSNDIIEQSETIDSIQPIDGRPTSSLGSNAYEQHRLRAARNGCTCATKNCGCCAHMTVRKIHLDDSACVNITYISEDIGIKLALSIDSHVFYSEEISVRNPPPICFGVPHLREYASLCVRLYDMDVTKKMVSGCSEIEAKLYHVRVARQKIGCFRIPI